MSFICDLKLWIVLSLITNSLSFEILLSVIMGKTSGLTPRKSAEVKGLLSTKSYSNWEVSRRLFVSESAVRRIKKKIEWGQELIPRRKKRCGPKTIFHQDKNVAWRRFALKTGLPLQKTLNPSLKAVTSMLLKELWGADCQIYSSKPIDPLGRQNWLLLWKWNVSTGPGTSRTKIWIFGNQWVIVQMLYFFYFLSCRILVRCNIHVYKLYFPLWSMKSWTHPVFSFLMKGLLHGREHIRNLSQEISICA